MTPPGASLQCELERLLGMDSEALIGAHGTFEWTSRDPIAIDA